MLGVLVGTAAASILWNTRVNNNIHTKLAEQGYKVTRQNLCGYKSEVKDLSVMHLIPVVNLLYSFYHGGKKYERATNMATSKRSSELLDKLKDKNVAEPLSQDEKNYLAYRKAKGKSVSGGVRLMRLRELFGLDTVSERTKAKIVRAGCASAAPAVRRAEPTTRSTGAHTTPPRTVSEVDAEIARLRAERARLLREEALRRIDGDTEAMLDGIDPTLGRRPTGRTMTATPEPRTTRR